MPWLVLSYNFFLNLTSRFFVKQFKKKMSGVLHVLKTSWAYKVNQGIASFCSTEVPCSTNSQVVSSRHQTDTPSTHSSTPPTTP